MKNKEKIISEGFKDFSSQTTIHGLNIIGTSNLHFFERLFWLFVVACAFMGAISLTLSSWKRYSENPTVVSLEKDYRNWLNPFPAVTGCFMKKVDQDKATEFIKQKWNVGDSEEKFKYYMDYITVIANTSFFSLKNYVPFRGDSTLDNVDMIEVAKYVHPGMVGALVTFDPEKKPKWTIVMTEMGICFSVNSKFANLLQIKIPGSNDSLDEEIPILRCHFLNGLCYARYDSDPSLPIKYYVHSFLDVIHTTSDEPVAVEESQEMDISFRMQETTSSSSLRNLNPLQRGCRFHDEPISKQVPIYSTTICYMFCRQKLALELCGCKPFFYVIGDQGKVCDVEGMVCLSNYMDKLTSNPSELNCKCPQPCDLVTYLRQIPKITKWEFGYFDQRITFRWGLIPPTTKYIRDVIFGIDSLVASSGGTVSLFLGMSVIGLIEFFYLAIENVIRGFIKMKQHRKIEKSNTWKMKKIPQFQRMKN